MWSREASSTLAAARRPPSVCGSRSCVSWSGSAAAAMRWESNGSDLPMPWFARAFIRGALRTAYPASDAARARRASWVSVPSIAQSTPASPPVRRAAQDAARDRPAVVAGNCASSTISPIGQARIEMAWLRAWVSTPMTNGRVCATMAMAIDAPLLMMDMVTVAERPALVREEVTSGRICDEPRPAGSGSLLMRSPRWVGRVPVAPT